jgi:NOL1/NOP2/sun family putative RNA methylase
MDSGIRSIDSLHPLALRYRDILDDPEAFGQAIACAIDRFLWINPQRTAVDTVRRILIRSGFETQRLAWHPRALRLSGNAEGLGRHWAYRAGLFHIQEASSMIPVLVMNPQPGERILDLCAAPGNKTAQIALALKSRGTVVSNDLNGARQRATRMVLDRLGLANVSLTFEDGVNYPRRAGIFDAVLVDAPCTCEGTSRRNPERCSDNARPYAKKADKQKLLLRQAIRRCAHGGRIVYSTCTYAPEENEAVVDAVMREWPGAVRLVPARLPGLRCVPGLTRWRDIPFHSDMAHTMRIWPHHNDTAGFFVALMEKTAADSPHSAQAPHVKQATLATSGWRGNRLSSDDPVLREVQRRFGFSADCFTQLFVWRKNRREISGVAEDHRPPLSVNPAMGMRFIRVGNRYPKLTTAAGMYLGPQATRNRIDLSPRQLRAYLARQDFTPTPKQRESVTGGYIMVRYQGFTLGLGCLHAAAHRIESLYPRHMAVDADHLII